MVRLSLSVYASILPVRDPSVNSPEDRIPGGPSVTLYPIRAPIQKKRIRLGPIPLVVLRTVTRLMDLESPSLYGRHYRFGTTARLGRTSPQLDLEGPRGTKMPEPAD